MPILHLGLFGSCRAAGFWEDLMSRTRFRFLLGLGAIAAVFVMIAADAADARSRVSGGSRGTRTYSAPPSTSTAPTTRPMERTMTQPTNPGANVASRPGLQ